MKDFVKCPRSGHKSSKRLISLVFCGAAVLMAFALVIMVIFMSSVSDKALEVMSKIIVTLAVISGGAQATTMQLPKIGKE